jgi:hypothetical protein
MSDIIGYHEFFSDDDAGLVILQIQRRGKNEKQTFVFDSFDSMEKVALANPDIPVSVWETLTIMQNESNAAMGIY